MIWHVSWYSVTDKEMQTCVGVLLSFTFRSLDATEDWARRPKHKHAKKNFRRNLRNTLVRYAAVRRLHGGGGVWPNIETRLATLHEHEWAGPEVKELRNKTT